MRSVTEDVLRYLDTNEVPEQWITNDLGTKNLTINEDFIDEIDLQEQIMETEITDPSFNGYDADYDSSGT